MLTPALKQEINKVIIGEFTLGMMEFSEMNNCHMEALQGFKRLHRWQQFDRYTHANMLSNFLVDYYHTEPTIQINYTSPATNGATLADALKRMHDTSLMHIETLKKAAKAAFDEGEYLLMGYFDKMIKDQSKEIKCYFRIWMDVKRPNADLNGISDKLHEKYKKKEEEYTMFRE